MDLLNKKNFNLKLWQNNNKRIPVHTSWKVVVVRIRVFNSKRYKQTTKVANTNYCENCKDFPSCEIIKILSDVSTEWLARSLLTYILFHFIFGICEYLCRQACTNQWQTLPLRIANYVIQLHTFGLTSMSLIFGKLKDRYWVHWWYLACLSFCLCFKAIFFFELITKINLTLIYHVRLPATQKFIYNQINFLTKLFDGKF